jgi:hypothetical protein
MALFGNDKANEAQLGQYSVHEITVMCDAAIEHQNLVNLFPNSEERPLAPDRVMKRLWKTARILRGRAVRFPYEGGAAFLSSLLAATHFIRNSGNDRCHKAIASIMYSLESVPNLWAFMRHCIKHSFILTTEAFLFDYGSPVYRTALLDLFEAGTPKDIQSAIRMIQAGHVRQGLNLCAPESTVPERGTVLHALCRAAASCPEPNLVKCSSFVKWRACYSTMVWTHGKPIHTGRCLSKC